MSTVVVGAQWGDEGKGKIIDYLSRSTRWVVRYQGGNNAGHTVYKGAEKYVMHLIPSGILHPGVSCVIGNGVVVDPVELIKEIRMLERTGIEVAGRLFVSGQCHMIFPYHRIYDRLREEKKGYIKIGTTGRGIGPCYSDRALRSGIRLLDLFDKDLFRERLRLSLKEKNEIFRKLYGFKGFKFEELLRDYIRYGKVLKPYIADTGELLHKALGRRQKVLFEGAQGTMLDLDQGTYPFVTSSSTVAGGAGVGTGVPPSKLQDVLGVAKAYTTRVGEGPFPTEFEPSFMEKMRTLGEEFGATTGRARRVGWFDAVVVKYAAEVNGLTGLALTKLDILDSLKSLKIAVSYKIGKKRLSRFPHGISDQKMVQPVYRTMPGWQQDTSKVRSFLDLPLNARRYVHMIENLVGVPIRLISVGKERNQVILR